MTIPMTVYEQLTIELCLPSYSTEVVWTEYIRGFLSWLLPFTLRLGVVAVPILVNVDMQYQVAVHPYELRSYFGIAENS